MQKENYVFVFQHKREFVVLLAGLVMSAITVIILMLYFVINTFVVKGLYERNYTFDYIDI